MIAGDAPLVSLTFGTGGIGDAGEIPFGCPKLDLLSDEKSLRTTPPYSIQMAEIHRLSDGNIGLISQLSLPENKVRLGVTFGGKNEIDRFLEVVRQEIQKPENKMIYFNLIGGLGHRSNKQGTISLGFPVKKSDLNDLGLNIDKKPSNYQKNGISSQHSSNLHIHVIYLTVIVFIVAYFKYWSK